MNEQEATTLLRNVAAEAENLQPRRIESLARLTKTQKSIQNKNANYRDERTFCFDLTAFKYRYNKLLSFTWRFGQALDFSSVSVGSIP